MVIPNRESAAEEPNPALKVLPRPETDSARATRGLPPSDGAGSDLEGNAEWLARCPLGEGIILLGGSSLSEVRVRFAQSQLRHDLTPSYWSLCGILSREGTIRTVPLEQPDVAAVPAANGLRTLDLQTFDDILAWPNIAVLYFGADRAKLDQTASLAGRRTTIDLPELLVAWLAYAWGTAGGPNPLLHGQGLPSAAYVETIYSLAGIELTPGLSSAASCPEAIWQASKWWHEYYAGASKSRRQRAGTIPSGWYRLLQPSAMIQTSR